MSLQRTTRRLPVRRQQRMLAIETPRFLALSLGEGDAGASFGVLAVLALLMTLGNHAMGRWFDGAPPLGSLGVIASASVGTLAWVAVRRVLAPVLRLAPAGQRRALATALARELEIAGETRAEIETMSWTATRAWADRGHERVATLVLECDAGVWVALRGPLVAARLGTDDAQTIGHRFTVERLRHTGALLSLHVSGADLRVAAIELAEPEGAADSELWSAHELPPAMAGAIGRAVAGYRG